MSSNHFVAFFAVREGRVLQGVGHRLQGEGGETMTEREELIQRKTSRRGRKPGRLRFGG